jgi:cell division GTPase FtsZ
MANKRRGAQPGNINALKHGFYSRNFKDLENADLEAMLAQDLESEIAMLRVVVRRAFELTTSAAGEESQDLDRAIHVMNSLGMASIRLGSLLKVQAMLGKRQDDIGAVISEALREVARDLKL